MPMQSKMKFMRGPLLWMCGVVVLCLCCLAGKTLAQEAAGHDKIYVVSHVDLIPPSLAPGKKLVQQYVVDTRKDKGLVEIEAGAQISRPNHLTVIEIWENQKAFDDHVAAAHTRQYRQQLDPMLGSPYDERPHLPSSSD